MTKILIYLNFSLKIICIASNFLSHHNISMIYLSILLISNLSWNIWHAITVYSIAQNLLPNMCTSFSPSQIYPMKNTNEFHSTWKKNVILLILLQSKKRKKMFIPKDFDDIHPRCLRKSLISNDFAGIPKDYLFQLRIRTKISCLILCPPMKDYHII